MQSQNVVLFKIHLVSPWLRDICGDFSNQMASASMTHHADMLLSAKGEEYNRLKRWYSSLSCKQSIRCVFVYFLNVESKIKTTKIEK